MLLKSVLFCYTVFVIVMERKNGYLILDCEQVVSTIPRNQGGVISLFLVDGQEYYFKECPLSRVLLEMFCSIVSSSLQIPTVRNDLAMYHGNIGVLSTSYNVKHKREISLQDVLMHYYIDELVDHETFAKDIMDVNQLYNLEDIQKALEYFYDSSTAVTLYHEIVDSFLLQCFLGNPDVHSTQLTILESEEPHISFNHDYERACTVTFSHSIFPFSLGVTRQKFGTKQTHLEVIREFLECFGTSYFSFKLDMLPTKEMVLEKMNSYFCGEVDLSSLSYFLKNYDSYQQVFQDILMECSERKR